MDKKDIYEHLAKIYLDASRKRKTKFLDSAEAKDLFFIGFFLICLFIFIVNINLPLKRNGYDNNSFSLNPSIVKIDGDNNSMYALNLDDLKTRGISALEFSARKTNPQNITSLKVEIINSHKERSKVYLSGLNYKWQVFRIYLNEFNHISDWSSLTRLSFALKNEEVQNNNDTIYINDIKFVR